jgi:uncharacterized protein (TIGR02186 family)
MRRQRFPHLALIAAAALCVATPAHAERIIISISKHVVQITSNFDGTQIVLFGSIERDTPAAPLKPSYDIVVTITGPRQTVVTRQKGRVLGIWANVDSRTFADVPSYLAVLTTRPVTSIVSADNARRMQIGLENIPLRQKIGGQNVESPPEDLFRENFVQIKRDLKLYVEKDKAVTFITPTFFRADIALPPITPLGNYDVEVKLLSEGNLITRANSAFELVKSGFEHFVAESARNHALLYGLTTALMALMTGWFASVLFRRD